MPKTALNTVEVNYLKEIYRAQEKNIQPTTGYLADLFSVKPPSAFDVLNRLAEKKMLERTGWGKFVLTARGVATVSKIIHNHRILETYFYKELGLDLSEACLQAARIDQQVGEPLVKRMCEKLNFPTTCIHGNEVKHRGCRDE
ncbi:MAG: metal-dependent transcriptional regulator [Candidatus Caldarchaeum sp.]|nr:metal-dependent transcriptional regulator [Candidatus Caldarchaeum sp.]